MFRMTLAGLMASFTLAFFNSHPVFAQGTAAEAKAMLEKAVAAGDRSALGQLSWHALLAREFTQALDSAERALKAAMQDNNIAGT